MLTEDTIIQLLGRAHPLVLHLPIGLLVGLVMLELWSAWAGRGGRAPSARGATTVMLWLTVFGSLAAAASGLLLAQEGGHGASGAAIHRNLGLVFTAVICAAGLCHAVGLRASYARLLVIGLLVMIPAGHFGSALTHGERFLYAPLMADAPSPDAPVLPVARAESGAGSGAGPGAGSGTGSGAGPFRPTFATDIAPVLDARCVSCHGPDRRKGGLRLDTLDGITRGGSSGEAVAAGDPASSLLLSRMRLPLGHDDHMPPASKPQPEPAEIDLVEAWIAAGAPAQAGFDVDDEILGALATAADTPALRSGGDRTLPVAPEADPADIERLASAFVHVSTVEPGASNLWVDLAPVASTIDDGRFVELVGPVAPSLGELHAARAGIGDRALIGLARAEALGTLDLSWTEIGPAGLASIAALPRLRVLRIVGTGIGDESIETISRMPALRTVYLWRTAMTPEGIASLRSLRPDLNVQSGADKAEPVETEGELAFTSGRPISGEPDAAPSPVSLDPVNQGCPVSGAPIDPSHAVVFEGRVIGFCCPNCLKTFVDDPGSYPTAISGE